MQAMRRLPFAIAMLGLLGAAAARADVLVARASAGAVQSRVLQLVNEARRHGQRCGGESLAPAAPLTVSKQLDRAAERHARDMARRNYFDHRAPDGTEPRDRVRSTGYRWQLTGENIAFGPESAEEVVAGWLASPGHCANIMDGRFREIGIGVAEGRQRGHIYWVQTFASPMPAKP